VSNLIRFRPRPAVRSQGTQATFTRPTPLFDRHGNQLRVVAPGSVCWIVGTYRWTPGPGEVERDRAEIVFDTRGPQFDVDRAALWVEE